jgi:predicted kinase
MNAMATRRKPALLLVSGAPGSGKTQLGRALSETLGMCRVNKAEIARALEVTDSTDERNHAQGWETYWTVLETLLDAGASVIADQTTWRGRCDGVIRERLLHRASVRNVHCTTPLAEERWSHRLTSTPHPGIVDVAALRERMARRRSEFDGPLSLGRPVLQVDTTAGYTPDLGHILEFASADLPQRMVRS